MFWAPDHIAEQVLLDVSRQQRMKWSFKVSAEWTGEEIKQLHAYLAKGMSAGQIASRMGRTRNAVIGKVHRSKGLLLLSPQTANTPAKQKARSLAARGEPRPDRVKAIEKAKTRNVAVFNMPQHGRLNAIANARLQAEAAAKAADLAAAAGGTPFLEAVEGSLCLFYVGSHLTSGGPEMPVCGQPRPGTGRYCAHHARLQYGARS